LKRRREDIVVLRIMGWGDGTTAVDFTVNAAVGLPAMTGPAELGGRPVNHVLPAWDLLAGAYGAFALLAAERFRRESGIGQEIRLPLGDLAWASLGHLGQIAEIAAGGSDRPRYGNDLYGAFGRDFTSADGRRVMLVAITPRQWSGLLAALGIGEAVAGLESELGVSFARDEGVRFRHRQRLFPLVEAAMAARPLADLAAAFDANQVCWGPYRTVREGIAAGDRFAPPPGLAAEVAQPSGVRYGTTGAAAGFTAGGTAPPLPAPRLGEHTDMVLAEVLGLPAHEIGRLHDERLVAGA
jgi:2-methylfumaryl-CoA isomerase